MDTQYPGMEQFFNLHLKHKQHWNKKRIDMSDAVWQELENDTFLDGIVYAKGSRFKVFETSNFGWIVFDKDTRDAHGMIPGRRMIKW